MFKLLKNEIIKILKRKNIYILLLIGILIMLGYNFYCKYSNIKVDIKQQYEKAYKQDEMYLQNYDSLETDEKYSDIVERVALEKYAIENNIEYNILLNTENKNAIMPTDARIALMRVFNNFDIIIVIIIIYIASTIILEEYTGGTIKSLLAKPHRRSTIVFAKISISIGIGLVVAICIIIFQYIISGVIFGFESYQLEAIRYNHMTGNIEITNLLYYMIRIFICKLPMYISIMLIALLLGVITSNVAINILICLGTYLISKGYILYNTITKYFLIYNWDISIYIFGDMPNLSSSSITQAITISLMNIVIIFGLLVYIFKNKEVKNI